MKVGLTCFYCFYTGFASGLKCVVRGLFGSQGLIRIGVEVIWVVL